MTCKECGHGNKDQSQFCANCGAKLEGDEICPGCNYRNKPDSKFCSGCGTELGTQGHEHHHKSGSQQQGSKSKARRVETKARFHPLMVGVFVVGGFVLLFLAVDSKTGVQEQERAVPVVEARSNDPALEAKVLEVASKFICSCGTCGKQPLDVCACETAVQERQYIRTSLQSGQSVANVAVSMQENFGWVKPEFSAKVDSLARKAGRKIKSSAGSVAKKAGELTVPEEKVVGFSDVASLSTITTKIATAADRVEIFSKFRCPCGQCGVDELKDCVCSHPRGAKEVKGFVDEMIQARRYTVAQLINEVENRYGNRKL